MQEALDMTMEEMDLAAHQIIQQERNLFTKLPFDNKTDREPQI